MSTIYKETFTSDDCTCIAKVKDDGSIKIESSSGYSIPEESTLMQIKDNGNGYYVKTKSYSSVESDHIFNLDYSEIEYIYFAYKALLQSEGKAT